jgi:hypothetical protein
MGRWPKFEAKQRDALVRALRAQLPPNIARTVCPEDMLIGKPEMVADAMVRGLSQSQAYAAVNTLTAQPFMLQVGSPQFAATLVNTSGHWHTVGRFELERKIRAALPLAAFGRMGGRPKKASQNTDL